jgi:hypothetical protein
MKDVREIIAPCTILFLVFMGWVFLAVSNDNDPEALEGQNTELLKVSVGAYGRYVLERVGDHQYLTFVSTGHGPVWGQHHVDCPCMSAPTP